MTDAKAGTLVREALKDGELAPVLVSFGGPAPQARGTVAIRLLLVIPHLIALWVLGVAAEVVVIIGWVAALVTGRLPGFAVTFLTGYLRWQTRAYAYVLLLTGKYPPFELGEGEYPVEIAVRPGSLNRLAVLLRLFLSIPLIAISALLAYGAYTVVLFVTWLIVLATGAVPEPLYQALAATLRYHARVTGFMFMLTSAYPAGLFGDGAGIGSSEQARRASARDPWTLALSDGAKRLVGLFLVLGVAFVATTVGVVAANQPVTPTSVLAALNADVGTALNQTTAATTADKSCNGRLSCQSPLNVQLAAVYSTLAAQLGSMHMPTVITQQDATRAAQDAGTLSRDFTAASKAASEEQYALLSSVVNNGYNTLSADLGSLQSDLKLAGAS
jgi:Domain of unknown function (DUF4389)